MLTCTCCNASFKTLEKAKEHFDQEEFENSILQRAKKFLGWK